MPWRLNGLPRKSDNVSLTGTAVENSISIYTVREPERDGEEPKRELTVCDFTFNPERPDLLAGQIASLMEMARDVGYRQAKEDFRRFVESDG